MGKVFNCSLLFPWNDYQPFNASFGNQYLSLCGSTDVSQPWAGVRSFFNTKLHQLQTVADNLIPDSAEYTVIKWYTLSFIHKAAQVDHQLKAI